MPQSEEALAKEVKSDVAGYQKFESRTRPGKFFYMETATGATTWERPNPAPLPTLSRSLPLASSTGARLAAKEARDALKSLPALPAESQPLYDLGRSRVRSGAPPSECGLCCGEDPECICTICICGMHRCPMRAIHMPYGPLGTEYTTRYPRWPGAPREPPRAPREPHRPRAAPGAYEPSSRAFKGGPGAERARAPPDSTGVKLPFRSTTTYRDTYVPKGAGDGRERPDRSQLPPRAPFAGTTEYRAGYQGVPGDAAAPVEPVDKALESGPFDPHTEYRDRYVGKPGRVERRPRETEPWSYGPRRDLESAYRRDYVPQKALLCPARLLKPKRPVDDEHQHFHPTGTVNLMGDTLYVPFMPDCCGPDDAGSVAP